MSRRAVFLWAGSAAVMVAVGAALLNRSAATGAVSHGRPNLLLVTLDTTRADHIGCYGMAAARTPNLDRLAAQGVRFSDAIAVAPITLPSHSSIMTGLLPPAHGVRDNGAYALGDGAVTLAERLKSEGYATQAFISAIVLSRRYNLNQGFDGYDDDLWSEDAPKLFLVRERPSEKTADRFIAWLDGWQARPERPPFFAWVHFFDPHAPYAAPEPDVAAAASPYDAEITRVDRSFGRLLQALTARGVLDDTLVVVTADHGESLGEHQERTHALFVYDATVHVPLIMRHPSLPAGRVYAGPASSIDILPTVLELLGAPAGPRTQGTSLLQALRGEVSPPDLPQYSESLLSEVGFGMAPLYAVRQDGYKWIRAPRPELYALKEDPKELRNRQPSDSRRSSALDGVLQRLLDAAKGFATKPKDSPMNKETLEMLQSLGYLAAQQTQHDMGGMDPKDGIGIYNMLEDARHLAQGRQWQRSEKLLRDIIARVPGHVSARNILALTLFLQGRLKEAQDQYTQSLAREPSQFRVLGMMGTVALYQNHVDDAEKLYRRALETSPGFVEAIANLGLIESLRGNEEGARKWYQQALDTDPGFPTVHQRFGDLYYERGEFARALGYYEKTLEIAPGSFQATIQAGNAARHAGDPAAARGYFQRASQLRPKSWIPQYNLACLAATTGDTAQALSLLAEARKRGLVGVGLLERDRDLDRLRKLPAFESLVAEMKKHPKANQEQEDQG